MSEANADERAPERHLPGQFSPDQFKLPAPGLELDFRLACTVQPRISVGPTPTGGHRNWVIIGPGWFSGRWGRGTVVPGGQDNQVVAADLSTLIATNYLLRTDDETPAHITVRTEGWRTGPREVLEQLSDPEKAGGVDPKDYKFRLYVHLESGDERYRRLSTGMWIASGARLGDMVVYDAYRVT